MRKCKDFFQDHTLSQQKIKEIWILILCTLVRIFDFTHNWIIVTQVYMTLLKSRNFMIKFLSELLNIKDEALLLSLCPFTEYNLQAVFSGCREARTNFSMQSENLQLLQVYSFIVSLWTEGKEFG